MFWTAQLTEKYLKYQTSHGSLTTAGAAEGTNVREASPQPQLSTAKQEEAVSPQALEGEDNKQEDKQTEDQTTPDAKTPVESTEATEQITHPLSPDYNHLETTPTLAPDHTPSDEPAQDHRGFLDTDEASNILSGELRTTRKQGAGACESTSVGTPSPRCVLADGFLFAMHRRTVSGQ